MNVVKKGSKRWEDLNQNSRKPYRDRLDYDGIIAQLDKADIGDFVTICCEPTHHANLVKGLSRRGLIHKEDYDTRLSDIDEQPVILLTKLEKPE